MEDRSSPTSSEHNWAEDFTRKLQEQRGRVKQFLAAQRDRLDRAQASLTEHAQRISEELSRNRHQTAQARQELELRSAELGQQSEGLVRLKEELQTRQADWDASRQRADEHYRAVAETFQRQQNELAAQNEEIEKRRAELDAAEAKLRHDQQALALSGQEHQAQVEHVAALRQRLEAQIAELTGQREQLQRERESVSVEKDGLANTQEEIEKRRAELDAAEAKLRHDQQALALSGQEHQAQVEHVAALRQRFEAQIAELTGQREQLAGDRARTEAQRRRIAQELRAQRAAHLKEIERRRAELCHLGTDQSGEADQHLQAIAQQHEQVQRELQSLDADRDRLASQQEEIEKRGAEIDASEAKLHHDQQALALSGQEHQAEVEHVAALRQRLEERITESTEHREQLAAERARMATQRRRIAQEFKAQRAAHLKEIDRRRAELDSLQTSQLARLNGQLQGLTTQRDQLGHELQSLQSERDRLADRLSETERQLAKAEARARESTAPADGTEADAELQRRYEMTLDDLRELKERNTQLEKQLEAAQLAGSHTGAASAGALDWEAEKRRVLAALEADFDQDDQPQRMEIEEVICKTEQIVAAKDREISDLQKLLADQSSNLGGVAVGAAALGELFDQDAVIQEERENLRRLQAEWEEKLRQAEIELSVERAKIARQRAEIEEQFRNFEQWDAQNQGDPKTSETAQQSEKPTRGRWLSRLGLADLEEE